MSRRSANPAFTDQEWQLNALMKETLLTFLTRIAFLLGDAQKDPDAPALLKHALGLLDDTLALWPNVPVKMSFLNRMLEGNLQQSLDPPPALLIGERAVALMLSYDSFIVESLYTSLKVSLPVGSASTEKLMMQCRLIALLSHLSQT